MRPQRVLFIGGSGVISSACTRLAAEQGVDVTVLNRGVSRDRPLPEGVRVLRADVRDAHAARQALGDLEFDAVVDWLSFTPEHVTASLDLLERRTGHYVFISSASAYQTPSRPRFAPHSCSTPATRSPARTCSSPPTASAACR